MKSIAFALVAFTACQRGDSTITPPSGAYARDIGKLCDVMTLSGAGSLPGHDRTVAIANWLAANLETSESHAYLVKIQPLVGEAHASALDEEAKKVGIARCALVAEWRNPVE